MTKLKKIFYASIFFGIIFFNTKSYAYPTLYNILNNDAKIKNLTTSKLLMDSVDKNKFWVLPPSTGNVIPSNFIANKNISYCNNIAELQSQSKDIINEINEFYETIINSQVNLNSKEEIYNKAKIEMNDFFSENSILLEIKIQQDNLQNTEYNLSTYLAQYNAQCLQDITKTTCIAQHDRINTLQENVDKINNNLTNINIQNKDIISKYLNLQNKTSIVYENFTEYKNQFEEKLETLKSLKNEIFSSYKYYATMSGGTAQIQYKLGWQKNIDELNSENTGIDFERISTKKVILYANAPMGNEINGYLSQLPSILAYTIENIKFYPFTANSPVPEFQLNDQIQANLDLSLVGSCPLENPTKYNTLKNTSGTPYFSIAISYQYPLVYYDNVTFNYNLYKIYNTIKSTSKGNYLDRDVYESVLNNSNNENEINYKFSPLISSENSALIKKDIKSYLLSKILKELTYPELKKIDQSIILENNYTGVIQSIKGNRTCLILDYACISDTWILKDSGSIFGNIDNNSFFEDKYNKVTTENWSLDSVYLMNGFTTFK